MSLELLRNLAFSGPIGSFIREPPSNLEKWTTGVHLKFDDFALAWAKQKAAEAINLADWIILHHASPMMVRQKRILRDYLEKIATGGNAIGTIDGWARRCDEAGYEKGANPVTIIVDIAMETPDAVRRGAGGSFEGFPIRYRRTPSARPFLGAGGKIAAAGNRDGGTLGGFLEDSKSGDLYGLTCEHVVGATGIIVDELSNPRSRIGVVSHAFRSSAPPPCNQHANPNAGTVDAALVKIDQSVQVTSVPRVTVANLASVDQDDPIMFVGAKSGLVNNVRVAAATIWKALDFGSPVCFADLFVIDFRFANTFVSPVSQGGDSGSWVMEDPRSPPTIPAWYGMLIGGDHQLTYACHAQHVFDWAKSQHTLQLP